MPTLFVQDQTFTYKIKPPWEGEEFSLEGYKKVKDQYVTIDFHVTPKDIPKPPLFMLEDIDLSIIGEFSSYEECERVFLELHPCFDKDSIKHYIYEQNNSGVFKKM